MTLMETMQTMDGGLTERGKGHPPVPAGPPRKGRTVLRAGAGDRHLYQRGLGDALLSEDRLQRLP